MGLEAIQLVDNLHLGGYWPVGEGATRSRRPPPRLGVETERGYWEENLPRELSMGDQGSRQLTPHPSPPRPDTEQSGPLDDALAGPLAYALEDAPGNQLDAPEFHHLPASRTWDTDEVLALQLDRARPPRQNLICIGHFCPDMAGEDEPAQMEETPLVGN